MAKFFRVIFNLLLICYILVAAAIFVPPLVGVTTAVTYENTQGNQTIGTVDYALRTPVSQITVGDKILVTDIDKVNVYTVTAVDQSAPSVSVSEIQDPVSVRTHVQKLLIAVPYIGYLAVLLQTTEGMIILGGAAAALLLLCIIFGIICRKKARRQEEEEDEEEEEEDEDDRFYRNLAEQKVESDAKAEIDFAAKQASRMEQAEFSQAEAPLDEEYEELRDETMIPDETELQETGMPGTDQTEGADEQVNPVPEAIPEPLEAEDYGDSADHEIADAQEMPESQEESRMPAVEDQEEIPEDIPDETGGKEMDEVPVPDEAENTGAAAEEESAIEEIPEEPEVIDEPSGDSVVRTGNIPGVQAALEAALSTQQIQHHARRAAVPMAEPEETEEPAAAEEIELAMPLRTADEYLQKAYADGDDPAVRKDELTGVTFIDYSDCI